MKDPKIVFIIGNGFDLDLGWKMQFSQFAGSEYWPSRPVVNSNMFHVLSTHRNKSMWFDLEQLIADYASPNKAMTSPNQVTGDKEFFNLLSGALISYLREQQSHDVAKDCTAAKVLSTILAVHHYTKIYSFNMI